MLAFADSPLPLLPARFAEWFQSRGWSPRAHQLALLEHASRGDSVLLVAPTGGGKTLAGAILAFAGLIRLQDGNTWHSQSCFGRLQPQVVDGRASDAVQCADIPCGHLGDLRLTRRVFGSF